MPGSGAVPTGGWLQKRQSHHTAFCSQRSDSHCLQGMRLPPFFSPNSPHSHGEGALASLLQGACGRASLRKKGFEKREPPPPPPSFMLRGDSWRRTTEGLRLAEDHTSSLAASSDVPEPPRSDQMLSWASQLWQSILPSLKHGPEAAGTGINRRPRVLSWPHEW